MSPNLAIQSPDWELFNQPSSLKKTRYIYKVSTGYQ